MRCGTSSTFHGRFQACQTSNITFVLTYASHQSDVHDALSVLLLSLSQELRDEYAWNDAEDLTFTNGRPPPSTAPHDLSSLTTDSLWRQPTADTDSSDNNNQVTNTTTLDFLRYNAPCRSRPSYARPPHLLVVGHLPRGGRHCRHSRARQAACRGVPVRCCQSVAPAGACTDMSPLSIVMVCDI
jgi:hypothetical protein